jgi:hypothetical protein
MEINKKNYSTYWDNIDYETIKKNDKYGITDKNGNIIVEPVFDFIDIDKDYVKFELKDNGVAIWPLAKIKELK